MKAETQAAIRAAGIAQRIADSRVGADQITVKQGIDIVTATDVACEDAIRAELASAFPTYAVIGEERGGSPSATTPYWLVDPICGTRPFASDVPLYCTNIALVDNGAVTVAAVGIGRTGEMVWAERGAGAWMRTAAGECRLTTAEHSHTVWLSGQTELAANAVRNALLRHQWYVWLFSSTLSYAYLASGRIAGIVHIDVLTSPPVHTAAGCLIAEEAGAIVTDLDGRPWTLDTRSLLLAATSAVHRDLRDLVERSRPPAARS